MIELDDEKLAAFDEDDEIQDLMYELEWMSSPAELVRALSDKELFTERYRQAKALGLEDFDALELYIVSTFTAPEAYMQELEAAVRRPQINGWGQERSADVKFFDYVYETTWKTTGKSFEQMTHEERLGYQK